MPIATALFVATCLGTPAIALTGLKLGMFAAVGGGIMGFATGKMFAEHELVQREIREETLTNILLFQGETGSDQGRLE